MEFLEQKLAGNTVQMWLSALLLAAGVLVVLRLLVWVVRRRLAALAARTATEVDDLVAEVLQRTRYGLLAFWAIYAGAQLLELPVRAVAWLRTVTVIAFLIQAALWADCLIMRVIDRYQQKHLEADASRVTMLRAASFVVRLVLFSLVLLLALDNVPGLDVTALITSMGIGGIAVALALQNVLADLFASLSIAFDKPFVLGDFIIVDQHMGTVEHVGLKTTRVRSLSGEQLVFGNHDLLGSRVRNFKRMEERRIAFSIGVVYQTPAAKLRTIPGMLREAVDAQPNVRFDRAHFKSYGDFALIFETVYYVLDPDYIAYMEVQQAINLALYERFEREGIEFAYPTQTLFLEGLGAGPQPRASGSS